jgi:hypothetical protein
MKRTFFILFTLFATSNYLMAKHVPKRIMLHYCTEVAAAEYNIPLQDIDTRMPVYKNNGFTVHGTIRHPHGYSEKFKCRFDAKGKFIAIKKEPRHPMQQIKKRIKHACKGEASVRWRSDRRDIKVTQIDRRTSNRFIVTLDGPDATGVCEVNRQGHIYRFNTTYKQRYVPKEAKHSCKQRASILWHIPAPFIKITSSEYVGRGRYLLELSSGHFRAECEVNDSGRILHFNDSFRRR